LQAVDGPIRPISRRALRLLISSSLARELLIGRQRDVFHSAFHIPHLARTRPPYFRTLRSSFARDSERLAVGASRLPRFEADHFQGHGTRKITCLSMSDARRPKTALCNACQAPSMSLSLIRPNSPSRLDQVLRSTPPNLKIRYAQSKEKTALCCPCAMARLMLQQKTEPLTLRFCKIFIVIYAAAYWRIG
jgi:hypothetical protein